MASEEGQQCDQAQVGGGFENLRNQRWTSLNQDNPNTTSCTEQSRKSSLKTQKVVRARDRKFHKRFKNLPESEKVLKVYHCAYVSDILLQGYLYITSDTFCFYSKILGRERQIEIPISEVVDVTREKTAFIIPNAIGIHTSDNCKYVFGSLVSRNRTYRVISSIWNRVTGTERYVTSTLKCDARGQSYKRDVSPSSIEKTSSDESYFTDPEYLPQSHLTPPSPSASTPLPPPAPSSSSSSLHRQASTKTITARRLSVSSAEGQGHSKGQPGVSFPARRASNIASASRLPIHSQSNQYSNAIQASPTVFGIVGKRSRKIVRLVALLNGITPTGWWIITCSVMTCILTLYGFVIFWKILHLQSDVMHRLYQLSLIENKRLQNIRRLNESDADGRGLRDIIDEYAMATDRLLEAVTNLQSIVQSNIELVIQMCRLLTSIHHENRSLCLEASKDDCT